MRLFNKVAIIGVGLIGGSIALAIKEKKLANKIIGVSRHRKSLLLAHKRGAIDEGSQKINIIKDADLLILATPVNTILNLAPRIYQLIDSGCIVIDVGSTKQEIVPRLTKLFPYFVGCHPLAGSEKRGIIHANAKIFNNSLCILTPIEKTDMQAKKKIKIFWTKLGAKVLYLTPSIHDRILSFVSHLPHVVAFSLIASIPKNYLKLASPSLKYTTRIAASDAQLWVDIFLTNKKNMLNAIKLLEKNISQIKTAIHKKDSEGLTKIFKIAKKKRELLR